MLRGTISSNLASSGSSQADRAIAPSMVDHWPFRM